MQRHLDGRHLRQRRCCQRVGRAAAFDPVCRPCLAAHGPPSRSWPLADACVLRRNLAGNAINGTIPTTLVSYLARLKSL